MIRVGRSTRRNTKPTVTQSTNPIDVTEAEQNSDSAPSNSSSSVSSKTKKRIPSQNAELKFDKNPSSKKKSKPRKTWASETLRKDPKTTTCDQCGKPFMNHESVIKHERIVHKGLTYICDEGSEGCGKTSNDSSYLKKCCKKRDAHPRPEKDYVRSVILSLPLESTDIFARDHGHLRGDSGTQIVLHTSTGKIKTPIAKPSSWFRPGNNKYKEFILIEKKETFPLLVNGTFYMDKNDLYLLSTI